MTVTNNHYNLFNHDGSLNKNKLNDHLSKLKRPVTLCLLWPLNMQLMKICMNYLYT